MPEEDTRSDSSGIRTGNQLNHTHYELSHTRCTNNQPRTKTQQLADGKHHSAVSKSRWNQERTKRSQNSAHSFCLPACTSCRNSARTPRRIFAACYKCTNRFPPRNERHQYKRRKSLKLKRARPRIIAHILWDPLAKINTRPYPIKRWAWFTYHIAICRTRHEWYSKVSSLIQNKNHWLIKTMRNPFLQASDTPAPVLTHRMAILAKQ